MPYTIYKSDGTPIDIPDAVIDGTYYSPNPVPPGGIGPRFVGANSPDYASPIAQNILQLTENFCGTRLPPDGKSMQGQLWFKKLSDSNGELYVRTSTTSTDESNWSKLLLATDTAATASYAATAGNAATADAAVNATHVPWTGITGLQTGVQSFTSSPVAPFTTHARPSLFYDMDNQGVQSMTPDLFPSSSITGFDAYNTSDMGPYQVGITLTGSAGGGVRSAQLSANWNFEETTPTSGLRYRVNDDTSSTGAWGPWQTILDDGNTTLVRTSGDQTVGGIKTLTGVLKFSNAGFVFASDGAQDTGMYWGGDGNIAVRCNNIHIGSFTPSGWTGGVVGGAGIGYGQTWQAVGRAGGTWYQNTTGKPIGVSIKWNTAGNATIRVGPSPTVYATIDQNDGDSGEWKHVTTIIPVDNYYYCPNGNFIQFLELR